MILHWFTIHVCSSCTYQIWRQYRWLSSSGRQFTWTPGEDRQMQQDSGQDMGPADEEWTVLDQQKQSTVDVWEEILRDMLNISKKGWYSQRFVTDHDHVFIQNHFSRWIEVVNVEGKLRFIGLASETAGGRQCILSLPPVQSVYLSLLFLALT